MSTVRVLAGSRTQGKDRQMASSYRIYGAEMSPSSVKARSYFRYKNIPHRWIVLDGTGWLTGLRG